jgi:O-antigen/teichoic acid export membrane protein
LLTGEEIFSKIKKILMVLILIGFFPTVMLLLWGEYIVSFVFGRQWFIAGKFTSFLSISLFFQFIISPFSQVFLVLEKQLFYLMWEIMRLIFVFVPLLVLNNTNSSDNLIIITMSVSISFSYILMLFFLVGIFRFSKK